MTVHFNKKFAKDLANITDKKLKKFVLEFILELESANNIESIPNIKKLKGYNTAFRYRLNDYRVGFFYADDKIELIRLVKRNDIYKVFP